MISDPVARINGDLLLKKYCQKSSFSSFSKTEETNAIFHGFYHQPDHLLSACQKLKALELLLYLAKTEPVFSGSVL